MPYPRVLIAEQLATAADETATSQQRGTALEQAASTMIGAIPGVLQPVIDVVDYATAGEIDILFPNQAHRQGLWFLDRAFLCECKNWRVPVGANEIRIFADKMRERNCRDGILIASHGITGNPAFLTAANHQVARALEAGREILVLDWQDLQPVRSARAVKELLEQKWIRLKSFRTSVNVA